MILQSKAAIHIETGFNNSCSLGMDTQWHRKGNSSMLFHLKAIFYDQMCTLCSEYDLRRDCFDEHPTMRCSYNRTKKDSNMEFAFPHISRKLGVMSTELPVVTNMMLNVEMLPCRPPSWIPTWQLTYTIQKQKESNNRNITLVVSSV